METVQTLVTEICPTTTQSWVKKGALLVDVREQDETAQLMCDVPNLVNIPLSEFENRYKELPANKELVIVCRSGGRSLRAAGFLIIHGYDAAKVVSMKHGIIRWVQKGFPTKGDTSVVAGKVANSGCCDSSTSKTTEKSCSSSTNYDAGTCC